jgi:hypothetical protein
VRISVPLSGIRRQSQHGRKASSVRVLDGGVFTHMASREFLL